jgi:hypothetical protein
MCHCCAVAVAAAVGLCGYIVAVLSKAACLLAAVAQDPQVLSLGLDYQQRLVDEVAQGPATTYLAIKRVVAEKVASYQLAAGQQVFFQRLLVGGFPAFPPPAAAAAAGGQVFGGALGGGGGVAAVGAGGGGQGGVARPRPTPANSTCRLCGQVGHWVRSCPLRAAGPAAGANAAPMGPLLLGPPGQP